MKKAYATSTKAATHQIWYRKTHRKQYIYSLGSKFIIWSMLHPEMN